MPTSSENDAVSPPAPPARRWLRGLIVAAVFALLGYLMLRASPRVRDLSWVPTALATWADTHGVWRNAPAFFAAGLLTFGLLGLRVGTFAALAVFATAGEVAQLWIPRRVFDPHDIWASLVGLAAAAILASLVPPARRALRALSNPAPKP